MTIAAIDITRRRGDTYAEEYQVISETTGLPIDITTGYSFALTVDPQDDPTGSGNNLFQITGSIVDAPNGIVEFAPNDTQADNVGSWFYDVQMIANGRKRTIAAGRWSMDQDITKL